MYLCIDSTLFILQQIHFIPLYPTVSSSIRTYLTVSSCIPLYLTVSHRLENGIWPKMHSRGGLDFTRYSFTSRLLCTKQSFFYCPSHLHRPTRLHYYCDTIVHYPSRLLCTKQSSFYCPSHPHRPTRLQYYCDTIVHYPSRLLCTKQSSFYCPSHLHRPTRLHNTIAILFCIIRPPSDPPFSRHTPYNIVHCNIV